VCRGNAKLRSGKEKADTPENAVHTQHGVQLANISRQGRRDVITSFLSLRVLLPTYSMKVYSLAVVLAPPKGTSTILSSANDTSSFSFYQRGSVTEFLQFFSRTVAERTPQGQRQSVQENNYTAHVYNRGGIEQLSGTLRV
jgi:hypothetical protein